LLAPSDAGVAYDLMEWPPAGRAITTAALIELDVPYGEVVLPAAQALRNLLRNYV